MNEWIIKLETKRGTRFSRFKKKKEEEKERYRFEFPDDPRQGETNCR